MDNSPLNASPALDVDRDLSCVRCGYNLRMLQQAGRCPECGTPVALTLELGFELAKSRPAYVRRLSRACWLLFVARALPFACVMVELLRGDSGWAPLVILPVAVLAYAGGLWLLAAREHPHLPPELRWTSRGLRLASLRAGLFDGSLERLNIVRTGINELMGKLLWASSSPVCRVECQV